MYILGVLNPSLFRQRGWLGGRESAGPTEFFLGWDRGRGRVRERRVGLGWGMLVEEGTRSLEGKNCAGGARDSETGERRMVVCP